MKSKYLYLYPTFVVAAFLLLMVSARPAAAAICRPLNTNPGCDQITGQRSALHSDLGSDMAAPEQRDEAFTIPEPREDSILEGAVYGWIEDYARFYDAPGGERKWQPETGFFYGPVEDSAVVDGATWYKVWGDWLPERYYHIVEASTFAGVEVNAPPEHPFGWILRPVAPRDEPDGAVNGAELQRYDFVQVYDSGRDGGGAIWYDVGPGQWVRYDMMAVIRQRTTPDEVGDGEFWVDVDLQQQIFAAYEGERMVYAGLISSGLPRWATRTGLNQVWQRDLTTPMEGGERGDDYYYIDHVPHTLYFDGEIALHGAFWHDDFGRTKSHGCVNMAPRVAEWVYYWSEDAPNDLWVWVHYSTWGEFL